VVVPAAEPEPVSGSAPSTADERFRFAALLGAALAFLVVLVPPVVVLAHRNEIAETVQFVVLALAVPPLLVLGRPFAPWRPGGRRTAFGRRMDRLAAGRRRQPWMARALAFVALEVGVIVAWRVPAAMDALHRHPWLVVVQAATLVAAGIGLWLELVASSPFAPRVARPWRAVLAVITMWPIWTLAYMVGFAQSNWYPAFDHATRGLSGLGQQELATGVLWFAAGCVFVPVVFVDVISWLKEGEDPDAELRRLIRSERRSGRLGPEGGRRSAA
jgi:cytochrome c oxidase assembly factor CtaG